MIISYLAVIFLGTVFANAFKRVLVQWLEQCCHGFGNALTGEAIFELSCFQKISTISFAFEAAVKAICSAAYLMIIGLILLVFLPFKRKTMGFIICGGNDITWKWHSVLYDKLYVDNANGKLNNLAALHKIFQKPIMPMSFSVIYLLVLIAVLLVFGGIAIGKFNYDNVTEVAS